MSNTAFFTELKALIAKYDPTTGVAEQPVQEQKNLFPEPGIWVFENKGNGKAIIDLKEVKDGKVFRNWSYFFVSKRFYNDDNYFDEIPNIIPSTIRRPQLQELLELPDECPGKLRLEHGQVYYVKFANENYDYIFKYKQIESFKLIGVCGYDLFNDENFKNCELSSIDDKVTTIRIATPEDLSRLPEGHELRGKKLATTYEEVVDAVKPTWICACDGEIFETEDNLYQLPTKQAAKQDKAFIQIKNLEAYCAERFDGERKCTIILNQRGELVTFKFNYGIIKVTEEAADWLIANHPEPFLVFFGVK